MMAGGQVPTDIKVNATQLRAYCAAIPKEADRKQCLQDIQAVIDGVEGQKTKAAPVAPEAAPPSAAAPASAPVPAAAPPVPPAVVPAAPTPAASSYSINPTTRIEEILGRAGKNDVVKQFTAINDECTSVGDNENKCREILKTAWTQLALQTVDSAEEISSYITDRSKQGVQYTFRYGSGIIGFTSLSTLLDYAKKGGSAGETGGAAGAPPAGGGAKGFQFGFSATFGTGYYPFNYDYARQDITIDGAGGIPSSTVGRDPIDDEETEVEVESLRQALTSETGAGERTEYKWVAPGLRIAAEFLGPEASGFRYAAKVSLEWDRFLGYSTQRLLNTAEHGNLHEIFLGFYPLGVEFGGSVGSVHLLGGFGPVFGILGGTAQAGPEVGLAEHPWALGVSPALELGYATPDLTTWKNGDVSIVFNLNGRWSFYIDDSNKEDDIGKVIVPVKGLSPEDHFTWMASLGFRVLWGK